MQDAILRLTRFWVEQGCHLGQPFNTEVGAGTLNPATFLRVLGPEPWKTVYVEPSVRPDDSRYGENPNRLQTHSQLQVILKPDPGNSQELYLASLAAIGIDSSVHDIRFVEDNWESPALGAWGLGWEVWLDGMEITQFTYFQQAGGLSLDPVSVEITYGLERIITALQGVTHFKDIKYSEDITLGELASQAELEMSTYYLDEADVETQRQLFETYEAEARSLIERRLPIPAHAYVLKCSHAFNVLDSRGAVGTTERARAFRRMRTLAHDIAELWAERREELGHPLGLATPTPAPPLPAPEAYPTEPATFVLELGYEELPPDQVTSYAAQLQTLLTDALADARLDHAGLTTYGSPRRILAVVEALAPTQPDREVTSRGPKVAAAFDAEGNATRAAEGFARKHGIDPAELGRAFDGDTEHVAVVRNEVGRAAGDVLAEVLAGIVGSISPRRGMRWGAGPSYSASRAFRSALALLGDAVVPFSYADVTSGRTSRVLRNAAEPVITIASADDVLADLRTHHIEFDATARSAAIVAAATALTAEVGGSIDLDADGGVLEEVTNLVENPQPLLGSFEDEFLRLPPEVLTVVMKKHQRYFPVRAADGALLPRFVTVANGPIDVDAVRTGNESVLRARYADAAFFFDRDLEQPLERYRDGLAALTFEEKVGSMLDRSDRISKLASVLGPDLGLDAEQQATLDRAAFLGKADLATNLVVELSSLAGQMGRIYAMASGEPAAVADAIFEGARPRFAGDALAESLPGAVLAIADRADALVALFAAGAKPTGSNDPYALRRAATGLVQTIVAHRLPVDLDELFRAASKGLSLPVDDQLFGDLAEFVATRTEVRLVDEGHRIDLVRAVAPRFGRPTDTDTALADLEALIGDADFQALAQAFRRVARISAEVPAEADHEVDLGLLEPTEATLWAHFKEVAPKVQAGSLASFATEGAALVEPINTFFDAVMVMAEDPAVRANRLGLLATIRESAAHLVDWNAVPES